MGRTHRGSLRRSSKNCVLGGGLEKSQTHLRQNQIQFFWYCMERTEFCTLLQLYARIRSDDKMLARKRFSLNFLWRWKQAHVVSSRGTAYLWDRILQVNLKKNPESTKILSSVNLGRKKYELRDVVLISELRGIESNVWFRRLWRSVSQRRMARETEKHKQKIIHLKQ